MKCGLDLLTESLSHFDPKQTPEASELAFSSVYALATTRQYRCNGNCEILVTAETFSLTVDVPRNGGKR